MAAFFPAIVLIGSAITAFAANDAMVKVELFQHGRTRLSAEAEDELARWSVKLLESANFNSVDQQEVLKRTTSQIHAQYRKTVAGDYFVVTFEQPTTVPATSGKVTGAEIMVGLNRQDQCEITRYYSNVCSGGAENRAFIGFAYIHASQNVCNSLRIVSGLIVPPRFSFSNNRESM
jgi:hypothetical protein